MGAAVCGLAAVAVAVGSLLTWAIAYGVSVRGTDADGLLTLVAAGAGLAVLPWAIRSRVSVYVVQAALALFCVGVVVYDAVDALVGTVRLELAPGLYLTLAAAVVWTGAAVATALVGPRRGRAAST